MRIINRYKLQIILLLIMIDYGLTYIGIKNGYITEGNPLMQWLFKIGLIQGTIFKLSYSTNLLLLIHMVKKINYKLYSRGTSIIMGTMIAIISYHIYIIIIVSDALF